MDALSSLRRLLLRGRGPSGIYELHHALLQRSISKVHPGFGVHWIESVNFQSFCATLRGMGVIISEDDAVELWGTFEAEEDHVHVPELIATIASTLPVLRYAAVLRLVEKFTTTATGIRVRDILDSIETAPRDSDPNFLRVLEYLGTLQRQEITRCQCVALFSGFSSLFPSDSVFVGWIAATWRLPYAELLHLDGMRTHQEGASVDQKIKCVTGAKVESESNKSLRRLAVQLVAQHPARGLRHWTSLLARYHGFEEGYISRDHFEKSLLEARLDFTKDDVTAIAYTYSVLNESDVLDSKAIRYALVKCVLSPRRIAMLECLWQLFPRNGSGRVSCIWLQERLRAEWMPAVVMGTTSLASMRSYFFDCWDVRLFAEGMVSFDDFVECYALVSSRMEKDRHFETMLLKTWGG